MGAKTHLSYFLFFYYRKPLLLQHRLYNFSGIII